MNNEYMEEIASKYPLPRTSYSQLNTFMRCPYDFYLTYMGGFTPFVDNKYTKLGSLLHDVYERQGKGLIFKKPFSLEDAFEFYNKEFMKIDKSLFDHKDDWIKMYQKGVTAIENYYSVYSNDKPLFVERKFVEKIGVGIPPVKSFIDRIDGDKEDPSTWILTDYKTGSQPKAKAYLKDDLQLGTYASQIFALYGVYPKALKFVHPVPNKEQIAVHLGEGVYEFTNQRKPVVTFSVAETIQTTQQIIQEIVRCIETDTWSKVPQKFTCKSCSHFDKCKPFDNVQKGWENLGN